MEATAVSLRPKVRPYERLCNTISSQRRQMAVSTFEAMAIPSSDGATAITRVEHQRRSRLCISRPQYETFTLPKQCRTTTYTQEFTISMSHRLCLLGKFSDVAGANRPKVIVTGGQLAAKETGAVSSDGRKAPARSTHLCGGPDRSLRHRGGAGVTFNKPGVKRFTDKVR